MIKSLTYSLYLDSNITENIRKARNGGNKKVVDVL